VKNVHALTKVKEAKELNFKYEISVAEQCVYSGTCYDSTFLGTCNSAPVVVLMYNIIILQGHHANIDECKLKGITMVRCLTARCSNQVLRTSVNWFEMC
jgi:hypothetical protein